MSRSKIRKDVVVGVTPDIAEKLTEHRKSLEAKKGSPVTQTDTIRDLFNIAFEKLASEKPTPTKSVTSYESVPRFNNTDDVLPLSL